MSPDVSLIIAAHADRQGLEDSLRSLARHPAGALSEVIALACGLSDQEAGDCEALGRALFAQSFSLLRPPPDSPLWQARNEAARKAKGALIYFLDSGSLFGPGWLEPLLAALEREENAGAVSPLPLYTDLGHLRDRALHAGICLNPIHTAVPLYNGFPASHPCLRGERRVQLLRSSSLLVPRALFLDQGGFDGQAAPGAEDLDFCAGLVLAGRTLLLAPQALIRQPEAPDRRGAPAPMAGLAAAPPKVLKLRADLEEQLRADGHALRLSPWLHFYPALADSFCRSRGSAQGLCPPDPAKGPIGPVTPLMEQDARVREGRGHSPGDESADAAAARLEAEPLRHEEYGRVAALLEREGRLAEVFAWRLLAARLLPDPENVLALRAACLAEGRTQEAARAGAFLEALVPGMEYLSWTAELMRAWCADRGREGPAQALTRWLEERESFRQERLVPYIQAARKADLLSAAVSRYRHGYACLRELRCDKAAQEDREMTARLAVLGRKPLFSVLMPVYNPEPRFLREALDSVLAQSYGHWQLCIADDASTDPRIAAILADYAGRDSAGGRIRVERRAVNGHICAASNTALTLAGGEYAVLMDHDDILQRHALAHVALALDKNPGARLIFSDEDKMDGAGHRFVPYFKPGFDPDLLAAQNYFSHLCVYATELLRQAGGFRPGFEGAQDHDLALRCAEGLRPDQILHLPHVLYHWRLHDDSTASAPEAKPYAVEAGMRAVAEHLTRSGRRGAVESNARCATHYDIRECLPAPAPELEIFCFCGELTGRLARWASLLARKSAYPHLTLRIVHASGQAPARPEQGLVFTQSADADIPAAVLAALAPGISQNGPTKGPESGPGKIIGLLRPGLAPLSPDWAERIAAEAARPEVGAVGGRIWSQERVLESAGWGITPQGSPFPEHAGLKFNEYTYFNQVHLVRGTAFVSGDYFFARAENWARFFAPQAGRLWPLEFCMRARQKGLRILCTPQADLYSNAGHTPWAPPGPEDPALGAFLDRWQALWPGLALHAELCPVPGGFGLAALQAVCRAILP